MDAVTTYDLGRRKVDALVQNLGRDLPHAQLSALPASVTSPAARQAIKRADVLMCCVDNDTARLIVGALACCYAKPLLDIGTGVFAHNASPTGTGSNRMDRAGRELGADVRLILPGDGCLLCWGGVTNPQEALIGWHTGPSRHPWHTERAGSLRSLNAIAAHAGIRLLEDLVAERITQSMWLRYEADPHGVPTLRLLPAQRRPACALCVLLGSGDGATAYTSVSPQ